MCEMEVREESEGGVVDASPRAFIVKCVRKQRRSRSGSMTSFAVGRVCTGKGVIWQHFVLTERLMEGTPPNSVVPRTHLEQIFLIVQSRWS